MPKYRITEVSFIDNRIVQAGEEIEVENGVVPAAHWEPMDKKAEKALSEFEAAEAKTFEEARLAAAADAAKNDPASLTPAPPQEIAQLAAL